MIGLASTVKKRAYQRPFVNLAKRAVFKGMRAHIDERVTADGRLPLAFAPPSATACCAAVDDHHDGWAPVSRLKRYHGNQ